MGIDVAPVDEVEPGQPAERLEYGHGVPGAEDHHGALGEGKRQVGDLVLDHVDPDDPGRRGEAVQQPLGRAFPGRAIEQLAGGRGKSLATPDCFPAAS